VRIGPNRQNEVNVWADRVRSRRQATRSPSRVLTRGLALQVEEMERAKAAGFLNKRIASPATWLGCTKESMSGINSPAASNAYVKPGNPAPSLRRRRSRWDHATAPTATALLGEAV
jgi:hypothetical protein